MRSWHASRAVAASLHDLAAFRSPRARRAILRNGVPPRGGRRPVRLGARSAPLMPRRSRLSDPPQRGAIGRNRWSSRWTGRGDRCASCPSPAPTTSSWPECDTSPARSTSCARSRQRISNSSFAAATPWRSSSRSTRSGPSIRSPACGTCTATAHRRALWARPVDRDWRGSSARRGRVPWSRHASGSRGRMRGCCGPCRRSVGGDLDQHEAAPAAGRALPGAGRSARQNRVIERGPGSGAVDPPTGGAAAHDRHEALPARRSTGRRMAPASLRRHQRAARCHLPGLASASSSAHPPRRAKSHPRSRLRCECRRAR